MSWRKERERERVVGDQTKRHKPPPQHKTTPPFFSTSGRHRWVVYGNLDWRDGQDAGSVPAEWHGWLHNITDDNPSSNPAAFAAPPYVLPHKGYVSGTPARYQPKGAWHNPARRNWRKVEAWVPPQ